MANHEFANLFDNLAETNFEEMKYFRRRCFCKNDPCSCKIGKKLNHERIADENLPLFDLSKNSGKSRKEEIALNSYQNRKIGCRLCSKNCYQTIQYENHWKKQHRSVDRSEMYENPKYCIICDRYFLNSHSLALHRRQCKEKSSDIRTDLIIGNKQQKCPICSLAVIDYTDLAFHLKNAHIDLRSASKCVSNLPVAVTFSKLTPKRFSCAKCGFICKDESSLAAHDLLLICQQYENVQPKLNEIVSEFKQSGSSSTSDIIMVLQPFKIYPLIQCDFTESLNSLPASQISMERSAVTRKAAEKQTVRRLSFPLQNEIENKKPKLSQVSVRKIAAASVKPRINLHINCRLCKIPFSDMQLYKQHFENNHADHASHEMFDEDLNCIKCCKVFENLFDLRSHYKIQHKEIYDMLFQKLQKIPKSKSYADLVQKNKLDEYGFSNDD